MNDDALYRALSARDARFDGRFFTGVTSTGIYCRPICRVRTPRQANCRFFEHAAQAEAAGFRPCLRCRPELAPGERHWSTEDASTILVKHATVLLEVPDTAGSPAESDRSVIALVAARLGVSDRHLRRLFEAQLGVSPLQWLLTRRLLRAKQLLADTALPVSEVALTAGFSSLRRFNAAFAQRYGMNPTQMRRGGSAGEMASDMGPGIRLAWRPPFRADDLLAFLGARAIEPVEQIDMPSLSLRRTLRLTCRGRTHTGWLQVQLDPARAHLTLQVSDGLVTALPAVMARVRGVFDLDADPLAIDATLHPDFPQGDGLRVPGAFDGFELAVRAVLGQQITVAAARTLATRLVERFGDPVAFGSQGLTKLFPSAETLAQTRASDLGELGIVRQRQSALLSLASAVVEGRLSLHESADPEHEMRTLQSLPGIGPWTAHYIAMRALRWPDAWPAGDIALHHALGLQSPGSTAARKAAELAAQRWRPWRSYALIRAWAHGPGASIPPEPSHDSH